MDLFEKEDQMNAIALIQLHDGAVDNISFRTGAGCRIVFEDVYVYHSAGEDLFEVWTYSAELLLTGLVETSLFGELTAEDDYIADDDVFGVGGEPLRWEQLIGGFPVSEVRLFFPAGFRFTARCQHAEMRLGERLKRHKDWHGPL